MGFHILKGAVCTGDIGKLIVALKCIYECRDLSDMAVFQFSIYYK